jgi:hypothetical protein
MTTLWVPPPQVQEDETIFRWSRVAPFLLQASDREMGLETPPP